MPLLVPLVPHFALSLSYTPGVDPCQMHHLDTFVFQPVGQAGQREREGRGMYVWISFPVSPVTRLQIGRGCILLCHSALKQPQVRAGAHSPSLSLLSLSLLLVSSSLPPFFPPSLFYDAASYLQA